MTSPENLARVAECLAFTRANKPGTLREVDWFAEVEAEARAVGLLPPLVTVPGRHCRPGIDRGVVYGGDREEVF